MTPEKFAENVEDKLTNGRLFPPIIGRIGDLHIAATLMRTGEHDYRGVALLANTDPDNNRVVKLKGAVGEIALETYSAVNGIPWSMEVGLPAQALRSLVDRATFDMLNEHAPEPLTSASGEIIRLSYSDPGVKPGNVPSVNGIPFEEALRN